MSKQDWHQVSSPHSKIVIEWSPVGIMNVRARTESSGWYYGYAKRADEAYAKGMNILQDLGVI